MPWDLILIILFGLLPTYLYRCNALIYPITTSSIIINTKPMAKPMVLRGEPKPSSITLY